MSLVSYLGERANLLNLDVDNKKRIMLDQPILSTLEINKLDQVAKNQRRNFKLKRFDTVFDVKDNFIRC